MMLNWLSGFFLTKQRALAELQRLRPNKTWQIITTDYGTVKVYSNHTLMTHRESLRLCMQRIRKYIKLIPVEGQQ